MSLITYSGPKGAGMTYEPIDWACHGKQPFRNRHDAAKAIDRSGRSMKRHRSRGSCEAYRCFACGAWHFGAGK